MPDRQTLKRVRREVPKRGSAKLKAQAARDAAKGKQAKRKVSTRRSEASTQALEDQPQRAASRLVLSRHAQRAARIRQGNAP